MCCSYKWLTRLVFLCLMSFIVALPACSAKTAVSPVGKSNQSPSFKSPIVDQQNSIDGGGDVTNQPVAISSNDVPWAAVGIAAFALWLFYKQSTWTYGMASGIEATGMKSVKQAVARRNGQLMFDWVVVKPVEWFHRSKKS